MLTTIIAFLEKSIELFKKNYNLFLSLSVISGILGFSYQTFLAYASGQNTSASKVILMIFSIIFLVVGLIYFGSRISISLFLLIDDKINSRETSMNKVFSESKSLFWNYLATGVKLVLLLIIPMSLFTFVFISKIDFFINAALVIISVISILYIILNYGLAINVSILQPNEISYFSKSKKLFKTNKGMVFLLFLFVIGVSALAAYIPTMLLSKTYIFNIIDTSLLLSTILGVFISPISSGLIIYTYWHLNKEQEGNELDIDTVES